MRCSRGGHRRDQIAVVDQNAMRTGQQILGIEIGMLEWPSLMGRAVHVCIGDNAIRRRLWEDARKVGASLFTIVHPQASIGGEADLGGGVFVAAQAVIAPRARLGEGTIVNHGAVVDHDCRVGVFCHVAPQSSLAGGVILGDGVLVGAGANVLPRVIVNRNAVVGAGAVVVKDVLGGETVVGVPAGRRT
ncbi:NeuD/PglB/VioB family sugar acetyltransferase [Devosia ginsengisoli]